MSLFSVDSSKVDKGLSSLFSKSSGPRQRPDRSEKSPEPESNPSSESESESESESNSKSEEVDDEEISEIEDELDDEKDVEELLESLSDQKEKAPRKRKRDANEMEAEDKYIKQLADQKDPEEPEEQLESKNNNESETQASSSASSKPSVLPNADEIEKAEKTVFVGNVSSSVISDKKAHKTFKQEFSQHGKVQSIRFRSIAFSEILPRKAAFIQQKLHSSRDTVNAYVVFETKDACKAAVKALNGKVVLDFHLRVDSVAHPAAQDIKRSVFIGNLDFEMTEEPLWKHFEPCGEVEYVRLVRDSKTNVGKGFGYIQFKDSVSVSKALLLDGKKIDMPKGRKLRVSRAKATPKKTDDSSKGKSAKKPRLSNEDKTKLGRAKNMVGKASKAQINQVIEGARAKVGDTVSNKRKKTKKPRIRDRSTAYKNNKNKAKSDSQK